MKKRQKRLTAIADILLNNIVGSQDELLELLLQGGYDVTQATLSRDLKTLRTSKIPTEMGGATDTSWAECSLPTRMWRRELPVW